MIDSVPHFGADSHPNMDALSDFVSGEGTPEWRAAVEAHLSSCDACREEVRALRGTVALLHALPQIAPPVSFQLGEEHARRIPASGSSSPPKIVRLLPVVRILSVAAVLLFMVIGGVSFYEGRIQDDGQPKIVNNAAAPTATSETAPAGDAFHESEGETSSEAPPKSAAVAPSQAGVVDRGESASASGGNPAPADAAQEAGATPPDSVSDQAETAPSGSVDNDDDAGFPWLSTSIGLGALALVLVGLWITLTRISRSR